MSAKVDHHGLRRYLLPGEAPVAEIRFHAIVLLKPALILLGATLLAGWLDLSVSAAASNILTWVWLLWLAVVGWTLWQWIEWRNTRVVATEKRIVLFEGWINHKVSMMPLTKVTDMGYERSVLGRLLGYGTFVLESAGQDQALSRIEYVPDPDHNYRAICAVVFDITDPSEDPGEAEWDHEQDYAAHLGVVDGMYASPRYPHDDPASSTGHSIYRSHGRSQRHDESDTGELPPYPGPY